MKLFNIYLFIGCYLITMVTNDTLELSSYTITDIKRTLKTTSLLLALKPQVYDLIINIKELFKNQSLEVGVWNAEQKGDILWETKTIHSDPFFAFYKQEAKSRNCLVTPNFIPTVKASQVPGDEMSLVNLIEYLNEQMFSFITVIGSLSKAGKSRQNILKNLFEVPKKSTVEKCERISMPSTQEFVQKYLFRSKPVIIENAINEWPAFNKWSNEFLRRKYADKRVHVKLTPNGEFEGCDKASKFENYNTFEIPESVRKQLSFPDLVVVRPAVANIPFSTFLDMVENKDGAYNLSAYLEYSSIREYFPELVADVSELGFIYGLLELSNLNVWLSNGQTLGKLHFDPFDNILCQLRGRKKLTLFAPHHNNNLYEGHIQEAILSYDMNMKKFRNFKLLDSTSMVMSPVDIVNPNFDRFSNFSKAIPMECTLNEGDILYMPSFWWHEVQSYPEIVEKRNLAVNFWYDPFLQKDFPCADCTMDINPKYKKLLNIF